MRWHVILWLNSPTHVGLRVSMHLSTGDRTSDWPWLVTPCAVSCRVVPCHAVLRFLCARRAVRELHLNTCDELGVEPSVKAEVVALLDNLQQLLIGICIMQV